MLYRCVIAGPVSIGDVQQRLRNNVTSLCCLAQTNLGERRVAFVTQLLIVCLFLASHLLGSVDDEDELRPVARPSALLAFLIAYPKTEYLRR
jgi:hypothetical protein